jgi:hypothetical protein
MLEGEEMLGADGYFGCDSGSVLRLLCLGSGRVLGRAYLGSQRQPSSFSQTIASPSPATPLIPWSVSRQYSSGS